MYFKKLPASFYQQSDVLNIAKLLVGKILVTNINGHFTSGRIVETEAYNGIHDKASHAYNNRRTARTEVMYKPGGCSYVYLCYGIHYLFNVVAGKRNTPLAVLIRALEPLEGIDIMLQRTHKAKLDFTLTKGPGNVCNALGIDKKMNGISLTGREIFICEDKYIINENVIFATPRIGVNYAAEDALLPYRFILNGNAFISGARSITLQKYTHRNDLTQ